MSANLAIGGGVLIAVIIFIVYLMRQQKKLGSAEVENERLAQNAEAGRSINEMEKAVDEKKKPDFGDAADVDDYLSGGMRDDEHKR